MQNVRVKLTDHGRDVHRDNYEKLRAEVPVLGEYRRPFEDENGWSKWQLHQLIAEFGSHVGMGRQLPFEPSIEFEAADNG